MDFVDLHLTERSSLDSKDLFDEFGLCVQVVMIILALQDLEMLKHILNVCVRDRGAPSDYFY